MPSSRLVLVLPLLALAACLDRGPAPEEEARRRDSTRQVCVTETLAQQARDNVETLEQTVGGSPIPAAQAAYQFAQVYKVYADARLQQVTFRDSLLYARTAADSQRMQEVIDRNQVAPSRPGGVGAAVEARYAETFTAAMANPDHPCNRPSAGEAKE